MQLAKLPPAHRAVTVAPSAAWTPATVLFEATVRIDPSTPELIVSTISVPTAPRATFAQAEARFNVWRDGAKVDSQVYRGAAHPRERQLAAALVDALRGSSFLTDARPMQAGVALPVGSVRITAIDADGTRRAVTMAGDSVPRSYAAFDSAADAYISAVIPM